jgi:hypothetical protein
MPPVYTVEGIQDLLEVFDSKVAITPKGILGLMNKGVKGTNEIPFTSITAIQFKPARLTNGYIQFTVPGGNESRGGVFAAAKDENTFLFGPKFYDRMQEITVYIEKRSAEPRNTTQQPVRTESSNLSAELSKLADLYTQGLLSAEEFQAAKSRLIGS